MLVRTTGELAFVAVNCPDLASRAGADKRKHRRMGFDLARPGASPSSFRALDETRLDGVVKRSSPERARLALTRRNFFRPTRARSSFREPMKFHLLFTDPHCPEPRPVDAGFVFFSDNPRAESSPLLRDTGRAYLSAESLLALAF